MSFRASAPLILVHLSEDQTPGRSFYAAFTLGEHRQVTPWREGKWVPLSPANITNYLAWREVRVAEKWPEGVPKP